MTDSAHERDERWMQYALALAVRAKESGEVPVGAVIVKGDELFAQGWNQTIGLSDPTAHAEIVALRTAATKADNYRLPGCELFVTLEPCVMCAGALIHARLDRIVFAAHDPKTGAAGSVFSLLPNDLHNHHPTVTGGVMEAESRDMLKTFFRARRNKG